MAFSYMLPSFVVWSACGPVPSVFVSLFQFSNQTWACHRYHSSKFLECDYENLCPILLYKKIKINRKKEVERKREIASYLVCILAVCTLFVLSQNACIFYRYFAVQDCRKVIYVLGHLRYTSRNIFPTGTTHPNGHRSLLKRLQKHCL